VCAQAKLPARPKRPRWWWHSGQSSTSIAVRGADQGEDGLRIGGICLGAMLALALLLGGCSSFSLGPSKPPPVSTDPNVFPSNYRRDVAALLRTSLYNPSKIRDAYISAPTLKPFGNSAHYVSCVRYNPRGAGNQYIGNQENVAEFLGGKLNQFLPATPELCADAVYQRFPEAESLVP